MSAPETAVFTVPVATRRGIVVGRTGERAQQTLAELETDLRRCRTMGAPDDASVAPTAPGSVYVAEVSWIGLPVHEQPAPVIDAAHLQRQREWSERTFGPGPRTAGVLDHIRKELKEIEDAPDDLGEWVDVVILALDGAWRAGHSPAAILQALVAKQTRNEARTWPDWRTQPADRAIEHDRTRGTQ